MAVRFTGTEHIEIPDDPTLRPTTEFTIACWIRPPADDGADHAGVVIKRESSQWDEAHALGGELSFAIGRQDDGRALEYYCSVWDGSFTGSGSAATLLADGWYFIVGRWSGGGPVEQRLYTADGTLVGTSTGANATGPAEHSSNPVEFGHDVGTSGASQIDLYWKGDLAGVFIHDTELTTGQIDTLLADTVAVITGGAGSPSITPSGGYWPLDTDARDISGNDNDGTAVGSPSFFTPTVVGPVRGFAVGAGDNVETATGGLSGMQFGTVACILRRGSTGTDNSHFFTLHDSGGDGGLNLWFDDSDDTVRWGNGAGGNSAGQVWANTADWVLVVARKATGNSTPRFSLYDFTAETWSHQDGGDTVTDVSAPGAGGSVDFDFEDALAFEGRVAVRAAWADSLPWSADASGDSAIEAAGLETSALNWLNASPDAMWRFNQDSTSTAVVDDTGNGADQTAISGTSIITGDAPPGFTFSLTLGGEYGRVAETETTRAFTASKSAAYGRVTEAETVRSFAPAKTADLGRVAETEAARAFTAAKTVAYGRVVAAETARGFGAQVPDTIGRVVETETVRAFTVPSAADPNPVEVSFTEPSRAATHAESAALSRRESAALAYRESA